MPSLSKLIKAKIESSGLGITAAAKKSGVSFPSFHAVLTGKSSPNARSVGKYATFLDISEDEVMAAAGKKPGKAERGAARKAGGGKGGRRGRPPGAKNRSDADGGRNLAGLSSAIAAAVAALDALARAVRSAG